MIVTDLFVSHPRPNTYLGVRELNVYQFIYVLKFNMNHLKLISAVQKHELLYNFNHPDYNNQAERMSTWNKVAAQLHSTGRQSIYPKLFTVVQK